MDMHIHSNFSDGANSPEEIVQACIERGYHQIAIVDHVRRDSTWVWDFAKEVKRLKAKYAGHIHLFCGIEAKVLDLEGHIDAKPEFIGLVDLVYGAFHQLPGVNGFMLREEIATQPNLALKNWLIASHALLRQRQVHVLAHPIAILDQYKLPVNLNYMQNVVQLMAESGVCFEVNGRYPLHREVIKLAVKAGATLSFGSDSHRVEEIPPAYMGCQAWFKKHFGEDVRIISV